MKKIKKVYYFNIIRELFKYYSLLFWIYLKICIHTPKTLTTIESHYYCCCQLGHNAKDIKEGKIMWYGGKTKIRERLSCVIDRYYHIFLIRVAKWFHWCELMKSLENELKMEVLTSRLGLEVES